MTRVPSQKFIEVNDACSVPRVSRNSCYAACCNPNPAHTFHSDTGVHHSWFFHTTTSALFVTASLLRSLSKSYLRLSVCVFGIGALPLPLTDSTSKDAVFSEMEWTDDASERVWAGYLSSNPTRILDVFRINHPHLPRNRWGDSFLVGTQLSSNCAISVFLAVSQTLN